ncbi:unnamed protein product [Urochloa humidicola]
MEIEKETNGTPFIKDRVLPERDQERRSDDDNDRVGARIGDHRSPDSERRMSKSLRSPSGDEEEGSRARENARKANSARKKAKDLSADRQLNKVGAGVSSPGEKSSLQQSGKVVQKKHHDQLSESSEDELAGQRMKHRTDSPDERSPPRTEKDSNSKDGRNSDHVRRDLRDDSDDAIEAKKYSSKVNEDSQSEDGSPVKKPKKKTGVHIDSGSSGSDEPDKRRSHSEKRRHKKAHKHKKQYDDSSESDSDSDGKDAKRRRKEEKRLRKEERRRRREERHRRRAERHASKQKSKHTDNVALPSDSEKDRDSDSDVDVRKRSSPAGREDSDQKKLEIELREKALESLRAKKAINN